MKPILDFGLWILDWKACAIALTFLSAANLDAKQPMNAETRPREDRSQETAEAGSGKSLICHYFNWFKTPEGRGGWHNWEWKGNGPKHDPNTILPNGQRDIASVYYPLIGPYDSYDPDVIEYHMLTARAAKIDGFFIDWYGIPSDEEKGFPKLLEAARRYGMKMSICFEDKAMFGYYYKARTREEAVENAVKNLTYILETHAKHPAYFKIDGVPVVINFSWSEPSDSVESQGFSAAEYKGILARVREKHAVYFVHDFHGHVKEQYWEVSDNLYPWLDVNGDYLDRYYAKSQEKLREKRIGFISGLVYPGFDNTGVWGWGSGPFVTPRENGVFYQKSWDRAIANDVRFLQLATWNDFGEGATIEPTVQHGFQYLEMTERNAAKLKGVKSDGGSRLQVPLAIYKTRTAVRKIAKDRPEDGARLGGEIDEAVEEFVKGRSEKVGSKLAEIQEQLAELGAGSAKGE